MPGPLPAAKTYKVSTIPPTGDESDVEDEVLPTRAKEDFIEPLWTVEDAKDKKATFGKYDCTVYEDGTTIRGADCSRIERYVRMVCAIFWTMDVEETEKDEVRNYRFLETNYPWVVERVAKKLELEFPILSWCEGRYKAKKWIEMRCKSRNEMVKKKAKKRELQQLRAELAALKGKRTAAGSSAGSSTKKKTASSSARANTSTTSASSAKSKEKTAPTTPKTASGKSTSHKKKTSALNSEDTDDDEAQFSVLEDDAPPATKSKSSTRPSASPLAARMQPKPAASGSLASASSSATAGPSASSSAQHGKSRSSAAHTPKNIMIPLKAGFDKTPSSSSKRQGLHIPTGPLQPTQMRSPATDSTAVNTFKQSWSSVLIGPSILALRKALIGYSELQEAKLLQETLLVLETAQNCGLDRRQDGDQEFLDWLQALETLQEPADDDEDERNSNFGHRAIGRFPYRDRLQTRDSWGSVKNACRLLSALLRIWSMAKAKIAEALTESSTGAIIGGTDPLCHNHIAQAAQVIQQAWKLPIGGKGKGRAEADRVVANGES
ncbi:hypothetical protein V8E36_006286 [Tilletia maclaganii]